MIAVVVTLGRALSGEFAGLIESSQGRKAVPLPLPGVDNWDDARSALNRVMIAHGYKPLIGRWVAVEQRAYVPATFRGMQP